MKSTSSRRHIVPTFQAVLGGFLLLALVGTASVPRSAAGESAGNGRTLAGQYLELDCKPVAAHDAPAVRVKGTIDLDRASRPVPGLLEDLRGSLQARSDGSDRQQRLDLVGGSIGRADTRGGAPADQRYVTLAFAPNDLKIEFGEVVLGPEGHSFLLGAPDARGDQARYVLDCRGSVLRVAGRS